MKKVKKISSYLLILLLLLQYIPFQLTAAYASDISEPKKAIVFADEIGGTIELYEKESTESKLITLIKDDSEVTVLEEGLDFSLLEYMNEETEATWNGYVQNSKIVDLSEAEEIRNSRESEEAASETTTEEVVEESDEVNVEDKESSNLTEKEPANNEDEKDSNLTEEETVSNEEDVPSEEKTANTEEKLESSEQEESDAAANLEEDSLEKDVEKKAIAPEKAQKTAKLMTFSATSSTTLYGIGLVSPTKVYEKPSANSKTLKSYAQGTVLKYETYTDTWHKATVYINGKATTGFIKKSDVENIYTSQSNLNGIGLKAPTAVYSKASRSSKVLKTYAEGTVLKYRTLTSEWYECTVYINGKATTGYIHKSDIENVKDSKVTILGVALKNPTNVYSKASDHSSALKSYPAGTILKYTTFTSDWYAATVYVNGKRKTGFIKASDVDNPTANPVTYMGVGKLSPTKVYEDASTSSRALKSYAQGSILKYESFISGWYSATVYVNGKKRTGYIQASHVENSTKNPVTYVGVGKLSPTKVYQDASTGSKALKSYPQGSILKYESFVGGWYSATVYINGKKTTGYIQASHVENSTQSPTDLKVWGIVEKVNVYSDASKTSTILKSYDGGSELKVETFTSDWYKATVYIKGVRKTGYIHKSDVSTRPYLELDLRKPAPITAEDIEKFFDSKGHYNSPLKKHAQSYINVQNKYGVNAVYLVAHAIWETGWGGSNLITYKNNLYGYGAYDVCAFTCGYYFDNIEESINAVAYMVKDNYLTPGGSYYYSQHGSTLTGMNVRYATDQNWKNGIARLMETIQPYEAQYYASASVKTQNGSHPGNLSRDIPAGKPNPASVVIDFPQGITATVNEDVNFRNLPYTSSSTLIGSIEESTKVTVLGYNTDVRTAGDYPYDHLWYRIVANGQTGWIYGKYLNIDNLLQVDGVSNTLNVRNAPNGDTVIGSASANEFLKSVLSEGKPVSSDGWYEIYLNSSKTGWVSGEYIKEIKN